MSRINTSYRIVFINDESLQEVASYKLTMRWLYAVFSTLFVTVVLLTIIVLLSTPLKYYIPGYGNNKNDMAVVKMKRNIDSLSDMLAGEQLYESNLRQVINGQYNGQPDSTMLNMNTVKEDAMKNIFPAAPAAANGTTGGISISDHDQ